MPTTNASIQAQTDSVVAELKREHDLTATYKFRLDSMTLANKAAIAQSEQFNNTHSIEPIVGVFIPVIAIVGGLFIAFKAIEAKRAVKLALIEKGMDATLLAEPVNENSKKFGALRYGLLLCGLGLGLIIGLIITALNWMEPSTAVVLTIASSILFGGLGMVIYHLMVKRSELK